MKVIDLLNKIANGEKLPKKIRVYGVIYTLDEDSLNYMDEECKNDWLDYIDGNELNTYEVEIIEEDKKIENLKSYISCGWDGTCKDLKREDLFNDLEKIGKKINEIIDKMNKE